MLRFTNMSIQARTFITFGMVLVVTIGLGFFALTEIATIRRASDDLGSQAMPSLFEAGSMLSAVINFRREEANRLLSVSADDGKYREKLMDSYAAQATKARSQYRPSAADEAELIQQFDSIWPQYIRTTADVLDLLNRGSPEQARLAYVTENRTHFDALNATLAKLVDLNMHAGERSYAVVSGTTTEARWGVIIALIIAACIALAAGVVTVLTTASPIRRLTAAMSELSQRHLDADIPHAERQDEIGDMARAVGIFKDGLVEADRLALAQQREQLEKIRRVGIIDALVTDFSAQSAEALTSFGAAASQLDLTAQTMSGLAKESVSQTGSAAEAVVRMTGNVQGVEAAASEMTDSISEITRQVGHARQIADRAMQDVSKTSETVAGLTEATQKIGEILTLIQAVASQTNLLALNATIEAARAGDVGKGFAVVAAEVKALAKQTENATDEIASQIAAVQKVSGDTSSAIRGIGGTISELNQISGRIAAAVEQQGAATQGISHNVRQASTDTRNLTTTMERVTGAASESGAAATQVLQAASDLAERSQSLQSQVVAFLSNIRAA